MARYTTCTRIKTPPKQSDQDLTEMMRTKLDQTTILLCSHSQQILLFFSMGFVIKAKKKKNYGDFHIHKLDEITIAASTLLLAFLRCSHFDFPKKNFSLFPSFFLFFFVRLSFATLALSCFPFYAAYVTHPLVHLVSLSPSPRTHCYYPYMLYPP